MLIEISLVVCLVAVAIVSYAGGSALKAIQQAISAQASLSRALAASIAEERAERLKDATTFAHELHNLRAENATLRDWITAQVLSRV